MDTEVRIASNCDTSVVLSLLREDFSQTLGFIDKCDDHIFKIRNWALLTASAVVAYSFTSNHEGLAFANIALLLPFMYLELMYKSFQDSAIEHTNDLSGRIDAFVANPIASALGSAYSHSFGRKLKYPSVGRVFSLLRNRQRWHILNFYLLLAAMSVGAYLVGMGFL